ncbi:hypothetical protein [Nonomuraea sp. NPDC049400]|uniref:hypothetical protein n=1 Tax=Nonomuraea sp. NPDC049400 TaxID=3364352 RepID=UPI003799D5CB
MSAVLGTVAEAILSSMLPAESYPFHPPSSAPLRSLVAGSAAPGVPEIVRRGPAPLEEAEATV